MDPSAIKTENNLNAQSQMNEDSISSNCSSSSFSNSFQQQKQSNRASSSTYLFNTNNNNNNNNSNNNNQLSSFMNSAANQIDFESNSFDFGNLLAKSSAPPHNTKFLSKQGNSLSSSSLKPTNSHVLGASKKSVDNFLQLPMNPNIIGSIVQSGAIESQFNSQQPQSRALKKEPREYQQSSSQNAYSVMNLNEESLNENKLKPNFKSLSRFSNSLESGIADQYNQLQKSIQKSNMHQNFHGN